MRKRCIDDCKWFNIRWNQNYCDKRCEFISNTGRFCGLFEPDTWWGKFLKRLGL